MRYSLYFIAGNVVNKISSEDLDQYATVDVVGKMWFSMDKPFLFIYDSRFSFWQQAWVNHQDKIRTIGVVPEDQVPDLVRMNHLIG